VDGNPHPAPLSSDLNMPQFIRTVSLLALSFCALSSLAQSAPRIKLEPFLRRLDKPIFLTHDKTDRLFIIEQSGRALLYQNGELAKKPYLDLSKKVFVEYECGLLCLVFHPDFQTNGLLYVNYTANAPNLKSFVSEFRADPKADSVDLSTERVLLTIDQPFNNHNGGQLQFGHDGFLYICMGDGGKGHDPYNAGQRLDTLLAKMLRIDVNKKDPGKEYAIPKDNPFINDPKAKPEIYAYGLRNAWRFSVDRATGLIYAADVGQEHWEEIDVIEKGGNYGWRIVEGKGHLLHPVANPPKMIDPIFEYNHSNTAASVTGGYVYRGKKYPQLTGWYLFGDYSDGRIMGIKYEDGQVTASETFINPKDPAKAGGQRATQPSAFGEDKDGELFLCDVNGAVYRIVAE
jgi:glucose/arabinose dehydrogenase